MRKSPERIAWTILFAALCACVALSVGVPSAVLAFYNTATVVANVNAKLQSGQLGTLRPAETERDGPRDVSLEGFDIPEGSAVIAKPDTVGLLTIGANDGAVPLLTVQLYSNANVRIERVRLPRFQSSAQSADFVLRLRGGRVYVLIQPPQGRKFSLRVVSDHASTLVSTPGAYSFEQSPVETRVSVADEGGRAVVSTLNGERSLNLRGNQHAYVSKEGEIGSALSQSRNLIRNGNFQSPLNDRDWKVATQVNAGSTISGMANIVGEGSQTALLLERVGTSLGWGQTSVTQIVNEDVRNRLYLELKVDFDILEQEIPVCGGEGSECPLMIRVDYRNKTGADVYWLQGFYGRGTPSTAANPDYIRSNPRLNKHIVHRIGAPELPFAPGNLLALIPDMQVLKSITLYAEGHAVRTQINSIELLLQD